MSSRDNKDTKSLQDKLKVFFKKTAPLPARTELVVSAELERELCREAPLHRRLRALRDLGDKTVRLRVHEGEVEKLWSLTRDLLEDSSSEARHCALWFARCVAEGQADHLLLMRTVYFTFLRETHARRHPDDESQRFKLLHTLTNNGKTITCFEEEIGPFLLEWLPQIQPASLLVEFLQLITNVVKFNATYLDEDIVHGIVDKACAVCTWSACAGAVGEALALLEAVLSYALLPVGALPALVAALCRAVNAEPHCEPAWRLMRAVLGADLGPAALHALLATLGGGGDARGDPGLVRGAVFFVNMALWGQRRVPSLRASPLAVLPPLRAALHDAAPLVIYEVCVAVHGCVTRAASELSEPAWDVVLCILRAILELDRQLEPPNEMIHARLHAAISHVEQLADTGAYGGDRAALLDLVEAAVAQRPESSALRLVTARAAALATPAHALAFGERFVRLEVRRAVRLHALAALAAWLRAAAPLAPELLEAAAAPVLGAAAADADAAVRAAAARALGELARLAPPDACADLVDLLERILNRPFDMYVTDVPVPADADVADLRLAVAGLLRLLHARLPSAQPALPLRCLLVLLDHLDHHYRRPALFKHHPDIRLRILEMLFALRANEFNRLGFCYDGKGEVVWGEAALRVRPVCSPTLAVGGAGGGAVGSARLARGLCACVAHEGEWAVLGAALRALPQLLGARAPAAGRRGAELDALAGALCALLAERPSARAAPSLSELHGAALAALGALAPAHAALDARTQQRVVWCLLKFGMVLRSPQPYINALTVFTLEARDTMVKMLPEVLLDLSKISNTQAIAVPMLEFLSTLTRLPKVFASFVEDQYMSVFAILLPYTNPSRYNHYVVSLAHHVIAAWFLKCRLSYRKNFVKFIIHGLHNYIIMPFEEQLQFRTNTFQQDINEDSSNRQRSSSLGSRSVRMGGVGGVGRGGRGAGAAGGGGEAAALAAFHMELTETCIDLLARYASSPCSVKPTRSDTAKFLVSGGHSVTWLVGHKLVTVTTSGCHQNAIKDGLCDRCAQLCRQHAKELTEPLPPVPPPPPLLAAINDADADAELNADTDANAHADTSAQHRELTNHSQIQVQVSDDTDDSAPSEVKRQNSSENSKATDPLAEVLNHFQQRFERISKEVDSEEAHWFRMGGVAAAGGCPCWCARWAEVHVRSAAGDVSWLMRLQNQMSWDYLSECPLEEVAALISPVPPATAPPAAPAPPVACAPAPLAPAAPAPPAPPSTNASLHPDLHKSSSDSVVSEKRAASLCAPPSQQLRSQTAPINIPGSPQRQSSSSTNDDDDMLLVLAPLAEYGGGAAGAGVGAGAGAGGGKARHPVRRSNSSPEMSTSWKAAVAAHAAAATPTATPTPTPTATPAATPTPPLHVDDMILLPSCDPQISGNSHPSVNVSKKPCKKSDMRVSCEAIPEEMSGTSPHHHHLMTFNSDPGTAVAEDATSTVTATSTSTSTLTSVTSTATATSAAAVPDKHHNAHHQLQKTSSDGTVGARRRDELPPLARSRRSNTISVMSPTRHARHRSAASGAGGGAGAGSGASGGERSGGAGGSSTGGGGVTPAFVFLQLYHNMSTYPNTPSVPGEVASMLAPGAERPLLVAGAQHERTVKNLDLVPPVETYRVGVLYVGAGQADDETAILRNTHGSVRYADFLRRLGSLVSLDDAGAGADDDRAPLFLNLEQGGADGRYTYVWQDDIMQVVFHVATAMPTSAADPACNEKRKHIGNDYVSIVYNESGAEFNINTIKGQLCCACVVVEPHAHAAGVALVSLVAREERVRGAWPAAASAGAGAGALGQQRVAVSHAGAAALARQLALHAALAAHVAHSLRLGAPPYAGNALERLRAVKRLRRRLEAERAARAARAPAPYAPPAPLAAHIDDFNDYT